MDSIIELNGDSIVIGIPITKVNAKDRTIEGFATLDNVDKSGDILDSNASKEAFAKWPGNIREMHQKKAVGKALSVVEKELKDGEEIYNGIWVKARISKGAEDTWQKVLDGTLGGFSVGGMLYEKQKEMKKDASGKEYEVWRVTKYDLTELSLVDNPCNGLAQVSLAKLADGFIECDPILEDGEILEKGHSEGDKVCCASEIKAVVSALESWRNKSISNEDDWSTERISRWLGTIRPYLKDDEYYHQAQNSMNYSLDEKEGNTMEKAETLQNNENSDTSEVNTLTEEDKNFFRKFAEKIVNILGGEEASVPTEELNKDGGDTPEMTEELLKSTVTEAVEELSKSVDGKLSGLSEALTKLNDTLEKVATKDSLSELQKIFEEKIESLTGRVDALENSGAVQKSAEDAGSSEKLEKRETGFWNDAIVPANVRAQMEFDN